MIVLDASAILELVLGTDAGRLVAERIADPDVALHSPHLLSVEVSQVLRRHVRSGSLQAADAEAALASVVSLDITHWDHEALLPRMWELRENLTAHDAAYVALAEALDAPLVTFDTRIAGAPGHRAVVEVPGSG